MPATEHILVDDGAQPGPFLFAAPAGATTVTIPDEPAAPPMARLKTFVRSGLQDRYLGLALFTAQAGVEPAKQARKAKE